MPDAISSTKRYLVVDGFINSRGITTIKLSRTYDISSSTTSPVETLATVSIEEEGGQRYLLREGSTKGTYTSANLALNTIKNYRLLIRTTAGKEYASDYTPVKTTPPIDNVTWHPTDTGLGIYVNSHDDANATQYYKWEYEETWEIIPLLSPQLEYKNSIIQEITTLFPKVCWSTAQSTDIKISSTTRLTRDVVSDYLLRSFSTTANQFRYKYSILAKQYALTPEEYNYWALLKKNTENIGTLFDPLPAQITGNVHPLNDEAELALGYVGVRSVEEKRIFISRSELPANWNVLTGYEVCVPPDTIYIDRPKPPPPPVADILRSAFGLGSSSWPLAPVYDGSNTLIGYTSATLDCVDCRRRGTAVRPSFWQ
ncbi:DUF4249 domain-containing protein [Hymenobacter cavernae]|uniref:DUF4249 domain-containing protein n=1 Tax=Hymenobacter cavernae TaxID=2044852 RepID=A0ABQ1TZM2_9BACT|nr:DUF4249 domain-containing protein [Hymenobacter cavernae]GGF05564.1 hypothetical protein GCM10011383_15830 [Hymenobacter cavernae]